MMQSNRNCEKLVWDGCIRFPDKMDTDKLSDYIIH